MRAGLALAAGFEQAAYALARERGGSSRSATVAMRAPGLPAEGEQRERGRRHAPHGHQLRMRGMD
ncbi:MAG TPA: hypothetical protein VEF89_30600 [Solirubrobacteraceae bacterium]|nr:hypothetical protein [Solirubrobacteraceae bacterium]